MQEKTGPNNGDFAKLQIISQNVQTYPTSAGKALRKIYDRLKFNEKFNCNTMHPITPDCLSCKHRHCKEGREQEWGMVLIVKHWCGIDENLMNQWSFDRTPFPDNCTYYEYGEGTIHRLNNQNE